MTARILITGYVQGVGFRQFVKDWAIKFGLKGWVKNIDNDKVEAEFVGEKEKIEKIIVDCKKGPFLSEVKDLRVEWSQEDKKYSSFDIIH